MDDSTLSETDAKNGSAGQVSSGSVIKRIGKFIAGAVFWLWQIAVVIFSLFVVLPEFLPELWVSLQPRYN